MLLKRNFVEYTINYDFYNSHYQSLVTSALKNYLTANYLGILELTFNKSEKLSLLNLARNLFFKFKIKLAKKNIEENLLNKI